MRHSGKNGCHKDAFDHGRPALMRVEQGEIRMRKSFKRPRDIHQLTRRILDIAPCENEGRDPTEANDPV